MAGKRITSLIGPLLNIDKSTTTQSITAEDLCYLASGKIALIASAGQCTSTNMIVIAQSRSKNGESEKVTAIIPGLAGPDFEYDLNTATTMTIGTLLKWSAAKTVAKSASAGEKRIGIAIENKSAAAKTKCRFFEPSFTK